MLNKSLSSFAQDERDTLQEAKKTLQQENRDLTRRKTGLEAQLKVRQDDLKTTQVSSAYCWALMYICTVHVAFGVYGVGYV